MLQAIVGCFLYLAVVSVYGGWPTVNPKYISFSLICLTGCFAIEFCLKKFHEMINELERENQEEKLHTDISSKIEHIVQTRNSLRLLHRIE